MLKENHMNISMKDPYTQLMNSLYSLLPEVFPSNTDLILSFPCSKSLFFLLINRRIKQSNCMCGPGLSTPLLPFQPPLRMWLSPHATRSCAPGPGLPVCQGQNKTHILLSFGLCVSGFPQAQKALPQDFPLRYHPLQSVTQPRRAHSSTRPCAQSSQSPVCKVMDSDGDVLR